MDNNDDTTDIPQILKGPIKKFKTITMTTHHVQTLLPLAHKP